MTPRASTHPAAIVAAERQRPDLVEGTPPPPAVAVHHLARRFGAWTVLRDLSFDVLPGQALGIAGANGSGKTVLLRLLAALDRPSAGQARVLSFDTVVEARQVRRRVGYVPEEPLLYDGLTARQYLEFVGRSRGLGRLVRQATVTTLLEVVGLERRRDDLVSRSSPGERRRLALAAALLHEPEVLLLDDPLRALDGQARAEQVEVLRELRRLGTTLVMTATRPEDVLEICETLAVLRDGVLAWQGDAAAALREAAPDATRDGLRVRVEVLANRETALALLGQHRDVRELEIDEDQPDTLWFLFQGDREGLAGLLPQLLRAGCAVAHFGVERRSAAAALASLFRTEENA